MRMKRALTLFFLFVLAVVLFADKKKKKDYLYLDLPKGGWSSDRLVTIKGRTSITKGWMRIVYNGIPFLVQIKRNIFKRRIVSSPGINQIYAEAITKDKKVLRDSVSFFSTSPPKRLKIFSTWDTNGSWVDLWITEPSGEICKWNHKQTKSGGTLDIGNDFPGYGPQIYTHPNPPKGTYKIKVHYYSDGRNAQSNSKVYVIFNEGTPNEIMKTYEATLTKRKEHVQITVLNIE